MRHILNFLITGAIVMIFEKIGWIQIHSELAPFDQVLLNQIVVAGIVGLIFAIGIWLAGVVFKIVVIGSCGLGCFLFPIYYALLGPAGFWLVMRVFPNWVTLNANPWQIILMGILIAVIRINEVSKGSQTTSKQSSIH